MVLRKGPVIAARGGGQASVWMPKWAGLRTDVKPRMDTPLDHERWQRALTRAALGIGASELHGLLAGYLCGGGSAARGEILKSLGLESDDDAGHAELSSLLEQARTQCSAQMDGLYMGFELLLPSDTRALDERADALVEWTRGFLGGYGLAGVTAKCLSEDGREVLRDLGVIAASRPTLDESGDAAAEDDESAWVELAEFVRVGAMLLHAEAAGQKRGHPQ